MGKCRLNLGTGTRTVLITALTLQVVPSTVFSQIIVITMKSVGFYEAALFFKAKKSIFDLIQKLFPFGVATDFLTEQR